MPTNSCIYSVVRKMAHAPGINPANAQNCLEFKIVLQGRGGEGRGEGRIIVFRALDCKAPCFAPRLIAPMVVPNIRQRCKTRFMISEHRVHLGRSSP